MIVKLVGVHHELVAGIFDQTLDRHTIFIELPGNSLYPTRSARYHGTSGSCSKEPDSSYLPRAIRLASTNLPSFVVEAGVSDSLSELRCDANSGSSKPAEGCDWSS